MQPCDATSLVVVFHDVACQHAVVDFVRMGKSESCSKREKVSSSCENCDTKDGVWSHAVRRHKIQGRCADITLSLQEEVALFSAGDELTKENHVNLNIASFCLMIQHKLHRLDVHRKESAIRWKIVSITEPTIMYLQQLKTTGNGEDNAPTKPPNFDDVTKSFLLFKNMALANKANLVTSDAERERLKQSSTTTSNPIVVPSPSPVDADEKAHRARWFPTAEGVPISAPESSPPLPPPPVIVSGAQVVAQVVSTASSPALTPVRSSPDVVSAVSAAAGVGPAKQPVYPPNVGRGTARRKRNVNEMYDSVASEEVSLASAIASLGKSIATRPVSTDSNGLSGPNSIADMVSTAVVRAVREPMQNLTTQLTNAVREPMQNVSDQLSLLVKLLADRAEKNMRE